MDDAVGKILGVLKSNGQMDNTLIIYTTDHGDMCGGHRMMDKHYVLYEDIVHVPFAIRWPGVIKPGTIAHDYVYTCLDIPPTIMEVLGKEPKDFFQGRSLMPFMKGEKPSDWRQEVVSTYNGQQFGLYTQRMIKNDDFKYIWNTTDVDEFYDMKKDPDELVNLIHEKGYESIIAELRKKLYEILKNDEDGLVKSLWMKNQLLNNKKL
jgi:arylsulfatase A-like enzyme